MDTRYYPKPFHLTYIFVMLFLGSVATGFPKFETFGLIVLALFTFAGFWIIVAGLWNAKKEYIETIIELVKETAHTRNPEVWQSMLSMELGFDLPEPISHVSFKKIESDGAVYHQELFELPASKVKLIAFMQGVLNGRSLSQGQWSGKGRLFSNPAYRKLMQALESQNMVHPNNSEDRTQGFGLTKKGRDFFIQYLEMNATPNLVDSGSDSTPTLLSDAL